MRLRQCHQMQMMISALILSIAVSFPAAPALAQAEIPNIGTGRIAGQLDPERLLRAVCNAIKIPKLPDIPNLPDMPDLGIMPDIPDPIPAGGNSIMLRKMARELKFNGNMPDIGNVAIGNGNVHVDGVLQEIDLPGTIGVCMRKIKQAI